MINEDELFEIIKTKPGKKSKYEIAAEATCMCVQRFYF